MREAIRFTGAWGRSMLGYIGFLIIGWGFVFLWSEPRWLIYVIFSAVLGAFNGALLWSANWEAHSPHPAVVALWERQQTAAIWYQIIFMVVAAIVVLLRGPHLRAKAKRDEAEIDAALAQSRSNRT